MNLDLYPIKVRINEAVAWGERACMKPGTFSAGMYPQEHLCKDIPALIAEVEKLREDRTELLKIAQTFSTRGYTMGQVCEMANNVLTRLQREEAE